MSVTFNSTRSQIAGWTIQTWCDTLGDDETVIPDRQEAERQLAAHAADCHECANGGYTWPVQSIEPLNWTNSNAAHLLNLLGYDTDQLVGSAPAEELVERTEREITWVGIEGDVHHVRRLGQLRWLAKQTVAEGGGDITWG